MIREGLLPDADNNKLNASLNLYESIQKKQFTFLSSYYVKKIEHSTYMMCGLPFIITRLDKQIAYSAQIEIYEQLTFWLNYFISQYFYGIIIYC